jgi:hypothetical protein
VEGSGDDEHHAKIVAVPAPFTPSSSSANNSSAKQSVSVLYA